LEAPHTSAGELFGFAAAAATDHLERSPEIQVRARDQCIE